MRRLDCLIAAFSVAALSPAEAVQAEAPYTAAEQTVLKFWEASKADKALAESMLSEDAEVLFGHIGGSFDLEAMNIIQEDCTLLDVKEGHQLDPFPDVTVVDGSGNCTNKRDEHFTFLVENGKISGALFFTDLYPPEVDYIPEDQLENADEY